MEVVGMMGGANVGRVVVAFGLLLLGFGTGCSPGGNGAGAGAGMTAAAVELERSELDLRDGVLFPAGTEVPFDGVMVESFPGGGPKVAIEVRRGRAHGVSRGWHENGQLEVEEHFVDGVSHGRRTRWYANGQKRSVAEVVEGVLDGPYIQWHENGQKAAAVTMVAGKPHGLSEAWHSSGAPKARVQLEHGEVVTQKFFDDGEAAEDAAGADPF